MASEYSYVPTQTVQAKENILFLDGNRCCKRGFITHRDNSGIFFVKGPNNGCRAIYKVSFGGNIAIAEGFAVGPISVSLAINGESLGNATATVTPAATGDFFNIFIATFIEIPCSCCVSVSVENSSDAVSIDVENSNIIFERVA